MTSWRLAAQIDDIRSPLADLAAAGRADRFAIATLVTVAGSAPREPGAQMLITEDTHWGFLSGGCIEDDVARHGREAMAQGAPRLLRYGEGSPWIDIKLACGSGIAVLVEPVTMAEPAVAALLEAYRMRTPLGWSSDGNNRTATLPASAAFGWDGVRYTRLYEAPLRLVLVGSDGTALAAATLAQTIGWEVALIAPGGPEAAPFPGVIYQRGDAAAALAALVPDPWTAIAVLSHDREDDDSALAAALASAACYVGAVGARARLDGRLQRLRGHGISEAQIARLHAPVGLNGFGKAPRDIALSLVAEVAREFHARSASSRSPGASISMSAPVSSLAR
ncbi:MAG: XdhC family protein [Porphyrobacter sp.]|jgi:xanthine dehydrogenase accessory factor|nr:XdhC family protein [Porphyrobacter sp.]